MILIVGLGNPGIKYERTRHNIGFRTVDILIGRGKWKKTKKGNCFYVRKQINNHEVEIIKPISFMNNSGRPVKYIQKKHNIKIQDIIVIHDDIDLPLGKLKISINRSAAGHKGVQSIINELGTKSFIRFRIGIAPYPTKPVDVEKFVLQKFSKKEQETINKVTKLTTEAVLVLLEKGIKIGMSKYN